MTLFLRRFVLFFCFCSLLTGCGSPVPEASVPDSSTLETSEAFTTVAETTIAATIPPEVTVFTEPKAPVPPETQTTDPNMPVLVAPSASEGTCHFFDDAAIMGDSISYSLMVHNGKTKDLGSATFLVRGSLGIHNTLNGQLTLSYKGSAMTPWDALAACGAKKVFIMMGTNDIGYYSIEETMTLWKTFLENIRTVSPEMDIYILSLTPMWKGGQQQLLNNATIDTYNAQLEIFAQDNGCHFVNIAPYFKDQDNSLAYNYCGDMYVHMNEEGTAAWANLLKAYAEGLLQ